MATPTANYGFIKDAPTQLYDVQVVNANLDAIDSVLKANANLIASKDTAMDTRMDAMEAMFNTDKVVAHSNPFTSATNWQITEETMWVWGPIVFGNLQVTRKNSVLTSNSNGNIGNVPVVTWNAGTTVYQPYSSGQAAWNPVNGGAMFGGYVQSGATNAGAVYVNALLPGTPGNVDVGEYLWGSYMYLRNL